MKRTRRLAKVNEHYIKKQGGCSGLKVVCDKQETETKTAKCEYHGGFSFKIYCVLRESETLK